MVAKEKDYTAPGWVRAWLAPFSPRRVLVVAAPLAVHYIPGVRISPGSALHPGGRMTAIRFKLSLMMFLEFFIWGAWFPLIFGYLPDSLHFTPGEQGWILGAFNLAASTAMFFSTQFANLT